VKVALSGTPAQAEGVDPLLLQTEMTRHDNMVGSDGGDALCEVVRDGGGCVAVDASACSSPPRWQGDLLERLTLGAIWMAGTVRADGGGASVAARVADVVGAPELRWMVGPWLAADVAADACA